MSLFRWLKVELLVIWSFVAPQVCDGLPGSDVCRSCAHPFHHFHLRAAPPRASLHPRLGQGDILPDIWDAPRPFFSAGSGASSYQLQRSRMGEQASCIICQIFGMRSSQPPDGRHCLVPRRLGSEDEPTSLFLVWGKEMSSPLAQLARANWVLDSFQRCQPARCTKGNSHAKFSPLQTLHTFNRSHIYLLELNWFPS